MNKSNYATMGRLLTGLALSAAVTLGGLRTEAAVYNIGQTDLGSGYSLTGVIRTDGATGTLTEANITGWRLTITAVSDTLYTPANTANISYGVTATANQLIVDTSPDGVEDGGSLRFQAHNHFGVSVADFSGPNAHGGQAYYVAGSAFDTRPLLVPNGVDYVAGSAFGGGGSVFNLSALTFAPGVVMSGTITTDGVPGVANITDWAVRIRETQRWIFNEQNSAVLSAWNLHADDQGLYVTAFDQDFNPGSLVIGRYVGFDLHGVLLGDFNIDPGGYTGLVDPFVFQVASPLPLTGAGDYVVALRAVPEPATWALLALGFLGAGSVIRSTRRSPALPTWRQAQV